MTCQGANSQMCPATVTSCNKLDVCHTHAQTPHPVQDDRHGAFFPLNAWQQC